MPTHTEKCEARNEACRIVFLWSSAIDVFDTPHDGRDLTGWRFPWVHLA